MPYNPATKTYTKTCNGQRLEDYERASFLKELNTLPADVETINIRHIENLARLPDLNQYSALKKLTLESIGLKVFDCTLPDSLETLVIFCNFIREMTTPLPNRLKEFDISHNPITALPALPDTLTLLGCIGCPIGALPPLPPKLEMLYASSCGLTSLPPLPNTLTTLFVGENDIRSFPVFPPSLINVKK